MSPRTECGTSSPDPGVVMDGSLRGVTVAVTRPAHQSEALAEALRQRGAQVVCVPLLEIVVDSQGMAELRHDLGHGPSMPDVVMVTSPNGARCLADVWPYPADEEMGREPAVMVVGPGTAEALRAAGGPMATAIADEHVAEGVLELVGEGHGRVVVAQGDLARPVLVDGLRARGWEVTAVTVYRTVGRTPSPAECAQLMGADVVTLASASAARSLADSWVESLAGRPGPPMVVMGPVTEREARRLHLDVVAVAETQTLEGLVDATVRSIRHRRQGGTTPAS